jgi:O-antigen/teichoic acid export membrane protein
VNLANIWRDLKERNTFAADAALTALINVVTGLVGVFTGVMAARLLGPEGRGELAAIQTYPTLIGNMVMLGTGQALIYYAARDPARAGRYLGCAAVISLFACLPFVGVAYAAMPILLSAQSLRIVAAARWYLIVVPVVPLISLALFVLRGRSDFISWNALRVTPILAWVLILAVAWGEGIKDPRLVAGAYLAAQIILLLPIGVVLKWRVPGSYAPDPQQFKPMLVYGLPCIASTFPILLNLRMDQMLMAGLLSPDILGLYVVAVAWSGAINPLMSAIGAVLFPKVAGHGDDVDRLRSFARGSRFAVLLALVTTPILLVLTPWAMVMLFGQKFRAAIPAGLILVPAGAIAALNAVIEDGFRGLGKPVAMLHAELVGLVVTAVSLYLLLRPMGIVGASIASILGYSTVTVVLMLYARSLTGESPGELLIPRTSELSSGMRQLALLARRMVPASART